MVTTRARRSPPGFRCAFVAPAVVAALCSAAPGHAPGAPAGVAIHPSVAAMVEASRAGITPCPGSTPCSWAPERSGCAPQECGGERTGRQTALPLRILDDGRAVLLAVFDDRQDAHAAGEEWAALDQRIIVDGVTGSMLQVRAPPSSVEGILRDHRLIHLGPPPTGLPMGGFESEGLAGMRVPEYWGAFGRGSGVRIGILDVGFAGYRDRLGSELPHSVKARSFHYSSDGTGDISGAGEPHGTACAEVVHDVAPEAELYLVNIATLADLDHAVDWLLREGVEVISHSVGWFFGAGDGTGPVHDIVGRAHQSGVIWVNAAGNFAQSHWAGPYMDADRDGVADVDEFGREEIMLSPVAPDREVVLYLTWDRWPMSRDLVFEIDLLNAQGDVVASSEPEFTGYPFAFRALSYLAPGQMDGMHARIRHRYGAPAGTWLRVVRVDSGGTLAPDSRVPEGSIVIPADSPDVLAVGAFAWSDAGLERFSSYGPSRTGLAKPDITGPNRVQNSVYRDGFTGTSAACPHVAGAIGLLYSAAIRGGLFELRWHPADVIGILNLESGPLSGSPPHGATGWGAVRLPTQRPGARSRLLHAVGYDSGPPRLRLAAGIRPAPALEIFDVTGRLLGRIPALAAAPRGTEYCPGEMPGRPLPPGIYLARDPVSGTGCSFYWPGP